MRATAGPRNLALAGAAATAVLAGCAAIDERPVAASETRYVSTVHQAARHALSPTEIIWVNPPRATEADRERQGGGTAR